MPKLRVIPLGSCSLTIPLIRLQKRDFVTSILPEVGFKRWPLSFSPGAALQLLNVARGSLTIPAQYRNVCYSGLPDEVVPDASERLASADLVLIEMSTPFELHFRRFILNHNRLRTYATAIFRPLGEAAEKASRKWLGSFHKRDEALRAQRAWELIEFLDDGDVEDRHLRAIIAETTARYSGEDQIARYLKMNRKVLGLPIGVVIFIFRYLPDGTPVEWPAGFNDDVRGAAKGLGIPVYDPAPLVQRHGVRTAIDSDGGHYSYKFNNVVADDYEPFIASLLDRK